MWPWEHLALAYLVGSALYRLGPARRPTAAAALAIWLGSQLPDMIDKPLAWTVAVLPSGTSLAHSLLFALSIAAVAIHLSGRTGRPTVGLAFALAYGSHLLGDLAYPALIGGSVSPGFLFWPIVPAGPATGHGLLARIGEFAGQFVRFLATPRGTLYLFFEAVLFLGAALVWYRDGLPGLRWLRRRIFLSSSS